MTPREPLLLNDADPFIGLAAAARLLPGEGGRSISPATVYRWGTRGLPLTDGRILRLKLWRIGRKWATTRGALAEFIAAQQPDESLQAAEYLRTSSQRQRANDAAERKLAAAGVLKKSSK